MTSFVSQLRARLTAGARARRQEPQLWELGLAESDGTDYQVAQLDDYTGLSRRAFPWRAPVELQLRARISASDFLGTWGFGWWNDPFSVGLGLRGTTRRLPTLPNAAWFFHASPPNYLALRDDHPAVGLLAATFLAPRLPGALLVLGAPALALGFWSPTARLLRRLARLLVREDAAAVSADPTLWHDYSVRWEPDAVSFSVDGVEFFCTSVAPCGPLGLVIWIDNQYMAFPPKGPMALGTLANPAATLTLTNIRFS